MNIQDLLLLYEYSYWATGRILAAGVQLSSEQFVAPVAESFGSLRGTLIHILDTERAWRVLCERRTIESFGTLDEGAFPAVQALKDYWAEEERETRRYLAGLHDNDLNDHVCYTLENGQKRDRILWHCLVHVVNHGTHHRSQAGAILKRFGHSPGELDLTVFLNEFHH